MATNRNSEHLRYRYGICLNDNCQKCKNKEVQQVSVRKDFVCEECGKPLRECPPPKSGPNKMVIAAIAAVIVIAVGVGCFLGFSGGDTPESTPVDSLNVQSDSLSQSSDTVTVVRTDTIKQIDTVTIEKTVEKVETPKAIKTTTTTTKTSKASGTAKGSVNLGYAKFTGAVSGGKPNGQGTMRFTSSHVIDSRDPKGRVADAGDYVIGEWVSGKLVQGRWYGSDNNVKGSIIIGM